MGTDGEEKVRYKNIFESFYKVKSYLNENSDIYDEDCFMLLNEFEKYLQSFNWATTKLDRSLFIRAGKGISVTELSEINHIKENTVRVRIMRLTQSMCNSFFDDKPFDINLFSNSDKKSIKKYTRKVQLANIGFDYFDSFDDDVLYRIEQKINETDFTNTEVTKDDIYQVLLVYARFSKKAMDSWFRGLNPKAMKYVTDELKKFELSDLLRQYEFLSNRAGYQKLNEKAIKQIDDVIKEESENE